MKKCLQTVNIYGVDMRNIVTASRNKRRGFYEVTHGGDGETTRFHERDDGSDCEPNKCYHHTPIYDEFREWVDEVREQEQTK